MMLSAKQNTRSGEEVLKAYVGSLYELEMSGNLPDRLELLLERFRDADRRTDGGDTWRTPRVPARRPRPRTLPRAAWHGHLR
jgi:hypothetical protein